VTTLRGPADALKRQFKAAAADFSDEIPTAIAADFLRGGAPTFARVFDRRGVKIASIDRHENEPWAAFAARAKGD
jgi:hypothetical protein